MSIIFKTLTLRNFLSTGNVNQTVNLNQSDLTLILGNNLDLGGNGSRNGCGKSVIIQALNYSLYGNPITNIRKDNLINRTNTKNMLVSLDFEVNNVNYRIERGRKPNVLRFYVNDNLQNVDDNLAEGENKETQVAIEKVINMSQDMFKHIVTLNTYTEPFLGMKAADQRDIIEQLLGITILSEKADNLKEIMKQTKNNITQEEYKIKAITEANKKVSEQIDSMKKRQTLWNKTHNDNITKLVEEYTELNNIDIQHELESHKLLETYNINFKNNKSYDDIYDLYIKHQTTIQNDIKELETKIFHLKKIDIESELQSHKNIILYNDYIKKSNDKKERMDKLYKDIKKESETLQKLESEIKLLLDHKCYACGQDLHDEKHNEVLSSKEKLKSECSLLLDNLKSEYDKLDNEVIEVVQKQVTHYKTELEALKHVSSLETFESTLETKKKDINPYSEQLSKLSKVELGEKPVTHYDNYEKALKHQSKLENVIVMLEKKHNEVNPYDDQIVEMETNALQKIDYSDIEKYTSKLEHEKFLLDLLTNKNSFVRKKIIDQNLNFLNVRLSYYLEQIGLPHCVVFKNDLSVEITEYGREMDYYNMSRGESNRLILALSFAFRDVFEALFNSVNIIMIDELIDSGMDTVGVENSVALLKTMSRDRKKNVWLVSHREELIGRVNNVLTATKKNGFTEYI